MFDATKTRDAKGEIREAEALIAEKVMGWNVLLPYRPIPSLPYIARSDGRWGLSRDGLVWKPLPEFFSDPAAMVELVGKLREMGYCYTLESVAGGEHRASFFRYGEAWKKQHSGRGATPMEAVAYAALKVAGAGKEVKHG